MLKNIDTFLTRLQNTTGHKPQFNGHAWRTRCPAHDDKWLSLSFHLARDGVVQTHCKSGCTSDRIMRAVGLSAQMLDEKVPPPPGGFTTSRFNQHGVGGRSLSDPAEAIVRRLDQCSSSAVRWLWPGRVPLGKLSLLVGDPGLGKSLVALDLAARVSRGATMPQLEGEAAQVEPTEPGSVVLLSAEDDAEDTVRPRLGAMGADLGRIVVVEAIERRSRGEHGARHAMFSLESNLAALEEVMKSVDRCRLVVIDPITAYLGRANVQDQAGVRRVLASLGSLAGQYGVTLLAVNHLTKKGHGPAIYRSMGSMAFAAMARSVLGVFVDPHVPGRRVLVGLKSNLASEAEGIGYEVPSAEGQAPGEPRLPVVRWGTKPIRITAEELLSAAARSVVAGPAVDEAVDWLATALAAGPQAASELRRAAGADGIRERTLLRAKARLHIATSREGYGLCGRWLWSLPKG